MPKTHPMPSSAPPSRRKRRNDTPAAPGTRHVLGDFLNQGHQQVLSFIADRGDWTLLSLDEAGRVPAPIGNSRPLGRLDQHKHLWSARFEAGHGDGLLMYRPDDRSWWYGRLDLRQQWAWTLVDNSSDFGPLEQGWPVFVDDFTGAGLASVLLHRPSDQSWWHAQLIDARLHWQRIGDSEGFGDMTDGRPIWVADFAGTGQASVLFHEPDERHWWRGCIVDGPHGAQLQWQRAGSTSQFGQVWDGRPFFIRDFTGKGRADVLFHYPGDGNWWLGSFDDAMHLRWMHVGNSRRFGAVDDGRPLWAARFVSHAHDDILLYHPDDQSWWLARFAADHQMVWHNVGRGLPFSVDDHAPLTLEASTDSLTLHDPAHCGSCLLIRASDDGAWWCGSLDSGLRLRWERRSASALQPWQASGKPLPAAA